MSTKKIKVPETDPEIEINDDLSEGEGFVSYPSEEKQANLLQIKFGGGCEILLTSFVPIEMLVAQANTIMSSPAFQSNIQIVFNSSNQYRWEIRNCE